MKHFKQELKKICAANDMTLKDLVKDSDISYVYLINVLNGQSNFNVATLAVILRKLNPSYHDKLIELFLEKVKRITINLGILESFVAREIMNIAIEIENERSGEQ